MRQSQQYYLILKKTMITGFNIGQMQHFLAMSNKGNADLTPAQIKKIMKVTPPEWLTSMRYSGTFSNTMNLSEIGFGVQEIVIPLWTQLYGKLYPSLFDKLKMLKWSITKDYSAIDNALKKYVTSSYIENMYNVYTKMKVENFHFTFNSHTPFLGKCNLEDSLATLRYVKDNFNIKTVELENETYLSDYLTGGQKAPFMANIDAFIKYLDLTVIPAIREIVGDGVEIGISMCQPHNKVWKYWRKRALELASKHNLFLAPHIYIKKNTDIEMLNELNNELSELQDFDIYITEFSTLPEAGTVSQEQEYIFMRKFSEFANKKENVKGIFKHTLFVPQTNHYSFVK